MWGSKSRPGRTVWSFLLSMAVCLASGAAFATCTPSLSGLSPGSGDVPCYIKVQPIDVCLSNGTGCAPFNTTSTVGVPLGNPLTTPPTPAAGAPYSANSNFPSFPTGLPNNPTSPNPIGFVVNPSTGVVIPAAQNPPQTGGVDITRELLNNIGVELVWFPMEQYCDQTTSDLTCPGTGSAFPNFTSLTITQATNPVATCSGGIAGFTLTITKCTLSSGTPSGTPAVAVTDGLSGPAGSTIASGTVITGMLSGTGGVGTYTVNPSQTVKTGTNNIMTTTTNLQSANFQTLSQQVAGTSPCPIAKMTIPANQTIGGVMNTCGSPVFPRNTDASTINMFFVSHLIPPASGGTLYGISWIGNNGVAIGGNTFFAPTPLQARPDTIAHELLHDLGLDHSTYGAGPWVPPTNPNLTNPALSFYTAPFGVAPPIPSNPLFRECDSSYPACGANLMTAGSLRNEPSVPCVLAPLLSTTVTPPLGCLTTVGTQTVQMPGLFTGTADQVTPLPPANPLNPNFVGYPMASSAQLPMSQQQQVLAGMSGLLLPNISGGIIPPLMQLSGLVNPIPYETTTAQLGTGGSSIDPIIFDLSGPAGGKQDETLVAWVLTLPPGKTFARHDPFQIVSQSRKGLVRDVNYYPDSGNNPLMRNIAYYPGEDDNQDNPSAGTIADSPCASATAECLMVNFRSPGLGAGDSISFSKGILKSILFSKGIIGGRGVPITNDDLCNAKITYRFSDGFTTTSKLGPCPAVSLPLIASSWRPDPTVAPQIIKPKKSNVLLAQLMSSAPSGASVMGTAYQSSANVTSAVKSSLTGLTPIATFTVPSSACTGTFTTLCFNDANEANPGTLGGFLGTGGVGATNITYENGGSSTTALSNGAAVNNNPSGVLFDLTGTTTLTNGTTYSVIHDDGMTLYIDGNSFLSAPGPTSSESTSGTWMGATGNHSFELVYGECCGLPAVLGTLLPLATLTVSLPGTPDSSNPGQLLFDLTQTGCTDCDSTQEGGQTGKTCNNGSLSGTISPMTVTVGQSCHFTNCEITGGLMINGGSAYLQNCQVDGGITEIAGLLSLTGSSVVNGGAQISLASTYNIGPGATINGGLKIQNTVNTQLGTVCGTLVNGGMTVQNNGTAQIPSPIQIGETNGQKNCPGNTIKGGLQCMGNNPVPTSGMNSVTGPNQCSG
jgi:hypothetical protein